jgi:hypothetical protein
MHWSCGKCGGDINDDETKQRFILLPEARSVEADVSSAGRGDGFGPIGFDELVKLDVVQICPTCGAWSIDKPGSKEIECFVKIGEVST